MQSGAIIAILSGCLYSAVKPAHHSCKRIVCCRVEVRYAGRQQPLRALPRRPCCRMLLLYLTHPLRVGAVGGVGEPALVITGGQT